MIVRSDTRAPTGLAVVAFATLQVATSLAAADWQWLAGATSADDRVVAGLNAIQELAVVDAVAEADRIRAARPDLASEAGRIAAFLEGVARERGGEADAAKGIYRGLIKDDGYDHAGISGLARLLIAGVHEFGEIGRKAPSQDAGGDENDGAKDEETPTLEDLIRVVDTNGWFLIGGEWIATSCRNAAARTLAEERSSYLSYKLFLLLGSYSFLPREYSFCFILSALVLAATLLLTPLRQKTIATGLAMRKLKPEFDRLRSLYRDDLPRLHRELQVLYRREGIELKHRCLLQIVHLIFFFWMLVAMGWYVPQLVLDGSRFFWVSDVTRFDFWLIVACSALWFFTEGKQVQVQRAQLGQSTENMVAAHIVSWGLVTLVAWYFDWPAYLFVFLMTLSLVGYLWGSVIHAFKGLES